MIEHPAFLNLLNDLYSETMRMEKYFEEIGKNIDIQVNTSFDSGSITVDIYDNDNNIGWFRLIMKSVDNGNRLYIVNNVEKREVILEIEKLRNRWTYNFEFDIHAEIIKYTKLYN